MTWAALLLAAAAGPPWGHSHNDYWQPEPFWMAWRAGMTSFEADVFLVDGELMIGHDRKEILPSRTLSRLYLTPMRETAAKQGGWILSGRRRATLMVDIKADGKAAARELDRLLGQYRDLVSPAGPLQVVVSGDRHEPTLAASLYAQMDGRISDLDREGRHIAWISDNWRSHFTWRGEGPLPEADRSKLAQIVQKAHARGRKVRFWAAPDTPSAWKALKEGGVDFIGTDRPAQLGDWLAQPQ